MSIRMKGIWLNLSGGGHRAAIYHFGALHRLHEAGLAGHVTDISATSGGALTAALWADAGFAHHSDPNEQWQQFQASAMKIFQRGLLGPSALIVSAYTSYALSCLAAVLGAPTAVTAGGVVLGLVMHACTAWVLIADGALTPRGWSAYNRRLVDIPAPPKRRMLMRALLSPSRARWFTLSLRAFRGRQATSLVHANIYLNAINLELCEQVVLHPRGVFPLNDPSTVKTIWQRRWHRAMKLPHTTLVAQLVAASSAFPPLFRPVPIAAKGEHDVRPRRFHFWDGGITDNAGSKLTRSLLIGSRSLQRDLTDVSLGDTAAVIVTLDASRPVPPAPHVGSRIGAMRRLVTIAQNAQGVDHFTSQDAFRNEGIEAITCGLRVGFIEAPDLHEIGRLLCSVRTNLDAFTMAEIGALAYCGYQQVDHALRIGTFKKVGLQTGTVPSYSQAKVTSLTDYIESIGGPRMSMTGVRRELERSVSTFSVLRSWRAARDRRATEKRTGLIGSAEA